MNKTHALLAIFLIATLSGCVTRQYQWDNYDGRLYKMYKDPTSVEEFRVSLKAHLEGLEAKGLKPAPGLYAELGTLHLERGDDKTALVYYRKERDAWKESTYLMDTMIAALEKRPKQESK
jgi:hypothetical protein